MGSLKQLPDGRWQIRAFIGTDGLTGHPIQKQRTITARNRRAAKTELAQWEQALRQGGLATGAPITIEAAAVDWLAHLDVANVTRREYQRIVNRHIVPLAGRLRLTNVTARDIERTVGKVGGAKMQVHTFDVLSMILERARRQGTIHHNPANDATRPKYQRPDIHPPTKDEVVAVLKVAFDESPDAGRLLLTAVGSGSRRGELAAITATRVDPDRHTLLIDRSVVRGEGGWLLKGTKTHQARTVPLDPVIEAALVDQLEALSHTCAAAGLELATDPFLWASKLDGSAPWHPDTLSHLMRRVTRRAGVACRLHDLRHAFATLLIDRGEAVTTVQQLLGHRSAVTTLSIYAHGVPDSARRAVGHVGEAFGELGR